MAVQNDSGFRTYTAGEALSAFRCVRFNAAGNLVYADEDEEVLGITQMDAASGAPVTIKLLTAPGTFKIESAGAITFSVTGDQRGTVLYVADDGLVTATPTTGAYKQFVALHGLSGAGVVEALPIFRKGS